MAIRICHVTSVHPAYDGRIFLKECQSLAKEYDVFLVAPNVHDHEASGIKVRGVSLPSGRLERMAALKRLLPILKAIDANVYHFHDPELVPIGLTVKKWGKKIVFDSHEDVPADIRQKKWIPKMLRSVLSNWYARYEKKRLSKYDALISVTPSIVDRLSNINPNTVMVTNFPIDKDLSEGRRFGNSICFAGGVTPGWMHYNIIESIKNLDITYILAGPSYEPYFSSLRQIPSWGKVDYKGVVKHDEVIEFYHSSLVGMALYDYNGYLGGNLGTLGNTKIFEFMQAGIPVIATDFILWKEIIEKNDCGICVNPRDINAIEEAIKYFLNHPDEAKRMGDNGIAAFKREYNWSTQEPVLLSLYAKLLS